METCFYNTKQCTSKLSREHVISKTVLIECFGEKILNTVSAEIFGNKILKNYEPVVKDVCTRCNSSLSPYDIAGRNLLNYIIHSNEQNLNLPITNENLNWLIKTHLNYFRVIKDKETDSIYPVKQKIKNYLIKGKEIPHNFYRLFVEEWENKEYFHDESTTKISFFNYRSIRFKEQKIVLSNLRLKNLNTLILLPSNKDYKHFDSRVDSCMKEIEQDYGYVFQQVDTEKALSTSTLAVISKFSKEEIEKIKYIP